jgi:hypothetical protein
MNESVTLDKPSILKMNFIMNALEKGWSVKKVDGSFIFSKKHEGKKEIFMEDYLEKFIAENMQLSL